MLPTLLGYAATISLQHSPGHIDCPACDAFRRRVVEPQALCGLPFREAAPIWLKDHMPMIAPKTHHNYEDHIQALNDFFGDLPLARIHIGHFQAYQVARNESAGPSSINHELNTLKQVLERAGQWSELAKFYKPLRIPKTIGRALEPEEEARLLQTAASSPYWRTAYLCSIVTATTTAGPKEITHLHVNDIDFSSRAGAELGTLRIRDGLKNGYRERIIPLNESSRFACEQLLKRYYKLCRRIRVANDLEHFLLVGRKRDGNYDPWKPMGSWRKAWEALRRQAGLPHLRMYDLRHHAITKLMEDPDISEGTVEEIAGHALSSNMKKRYSHIRMKPKSDAAAKLVLALPESYSKELPPRKPPQSERSIARAFASASYLAESDKEPRKTDG